MMDTPTISQRIKATQDRVVGLRDQLNDHMKTLDDENPDDTANQVTKELTSKIDAQEAALDNLKAAEKKLITKAAQTVQDDPADNKGESNLVVRNIRPFAVPAKKVRPADYLWRSLACEVKFQHFKGRKTFDQVIKENYGEDDVVRTVADRMLTRAATAPATTTTAGWAADLVTTVWGDFMESLFPLAVYPQLRAKGGAFTFGQNGVVAIPSRDATPTVAGAFVLQGAPIPVKQGSFSAITLTPKKMAVITTMTREIAEHSTPAIEGLLRQAILDDTAVALDAILLDSTVASLTRPAGLMYGVTTTGASVTATIVGLIADAKNLVGQLITSSYGNLRSPVWLIAPTDVIAIQMMQTTTGDLPFRDEIARGTFFGIPFIQSTTVSTAQSDTLILMDAADFVTATGDTPRFDVSDQAVLTFDDTTPTDITTAAVAATTKSLWQTDSLGIRMIMDLNWAMRRSSMVKGLVTLAWN